MITQSQIWRDAGTIAEDAFFELGESWLGPRLEMTTERIAEVLFEYQWRARTETEYARWLKCVRRAAMEMVRSGRMPGGARLSMRAERQFVG